MFTLQFLLEMLRTRTWTAMLARCMVGARDSQGGANVVVARLNVQQPVVSSFAHEVKISTRHAYTNIRTHVHVYTHH